MNPVAARVQARLVAGRSRPTAERIAALVQEEAPLLAPVVADASVAEILASVEGLGPIDALLADDAVSDVMVNGDGSVWIERAGALARTDIRFDAPDVYRMIERIVAPLGLRADPGSPIVDARTPDGCRVHAIVPPLAIDGPSITIRRFATRIVELDDFCPADVAALLADAVAAGSNIVVSGGTGSGKTTLLNALAASIPSGERVITVEDAAELRLRQLHVVRLESRPANVEGAGRVTTRDLVRAALRMRPDRIIVGECRGGEAIDMLQAMNTGHDGSLTTCHANSPDDALRRLETMSLLGDGAVPLEAIREQLASAIDLVVQVARGKDGRRRIAAVAEVLPAEPTRADVDGAQPRSHPYSYSRTRLLATADSVVAQPVRQRRR